jgi:hypothetical protein
MIRSRWVASLLTMGMQFPHNPAEFAERNHPERPHHLHCAISVYLSTAHNPGHQPRGGAASALMPLFSAAVTEHLDLFFSNFPYIHHLHMPLVGANSLLSRSSLLYAQVFSLHSESSHSRQVHLDNCGHKLQHSLQQSYLYFFPMVPDFFWIKF